MVTGCGGSGSSSSVPVGPSSVGGGSDGGTGGPSGGSGGSGGGGAGGSPGGVDGGAGGAGSGGGSGGGAGGGGGSGGGQTCTLAGPTPLAPTHAVIKIIVDGNDLYFLDTASAYAGVYRMAKTGGAPTLLTSVDSLQNDGFGWDLSVDDRAIYVTYSRVDSPDPSANGVTIIDKASGTSRYVAATKYGCTTPVVEHLAAYGGTVWLAQQNEVPPQSSCTQSSSNTLETIAPGATQPQMQASIAQGSFPLLADQTHLFWGADNGTFRQLQSGGPAEQLAPIGPDDLATDGNSLYATVGEYVYAIGAPGQIQLIYTTAPPFFPTQGLAVDDARVYVATTNGVVAVDKDGANPQTIATGNATAVAVDATNVYYFTPDWLMTVCK